VGAQGVPAFAADVGVDLARERQVGAFARPLERRQRDHHEHEIAVDGFDGGGKRCGGHVGGRGGHGGGGGGGLGARRASALLFRVKEGRCALNEAPCAGRTLRGGCARRLTMYHLDSV
jgi:hypothetical protein